jgi:hypothetical protein
MTGRGDSKQTTKLTKKLMTISARLMVVISEGTYGTIYDPGAQEILYAP